MNPRLRHLLTRALLALALVFAQQVGVAHAAAHAGAHGSGHEHRKGLKVQACDDCLSFAQVQGAGQATVAVSPGVQDALPHPARSGAGRIARRLAAFLSRAPPPLPAS